MTEPAAHAPNSAPPRLNHEQLLAAQAETLATPRRDYAVAARILFAMWRDGVPYNAARTQPTTRAHGGAAIKETEAPSARPS